MTNSTITQNTAGTLGGGIDNDGGPLTVWNALVARNSAPVAPDLFSFPPPAARFSLIANGEASFILPVPGGGNQVGTSASPINPRLGPLQNNGGPTKTHALLLGSPAIDRGTLEGCPASDQRGVRRPQGLTCDIGSVERVRETKK